jgi:hypothetical protein
MLGKRIGSMSNSWVNSLLAALFLNPKTIDYHQCNVSRKLECLRRGDLAVALVAGRLSA